MLFPAGLIKIGIDRLHLKRFMSLLPKKPRAFLTRPSGLYGGRVQIPTLQIIDELGVFNAYYKLSQNNRMSLGAIAKRPNLLI